MQALARGPTVEKVFLSTLMTTCMSSVDELTDSLYRNRTAAKISSSEDMLVLPSVLSFIASIATQSDQGCETILEAGVLDMLLHIYIVFTTLSDTAPQDAYLKEALHGACRLILGILDQSPQRQRTAVFNHPVCILWTDCHSNPPGYAVETNIQDRSAAWRRADRSNVMRRVLAIYRFKNDAVDLCADIIELANAQFYDVEVVDLSFLVMLKQIISNKAEPLISVLANSSHESTVRVFSGLIRLWLECTGLQINNEVHTQSMAPTSLDYVTMPQVETVHKPFCNQEREALMVQIMNTDTALYHMLRFATETAKQNDTVRLGVLDGGSLALVLMAFANIEFRLSSLVSVPRKEEIPKGTKSGRRSNVDAQASEPISLAAINAEAAALSIFVHSPKFNDSWQGKRLGTRLSLCSSLVNSLLGRDSVADEGYEVTRALFRKIVTVDL
ncbi:hypothetical protein PILCRDRAFT_459797 [Piloderma croceum F 1598]|uniref:Uncharacterized protein n=1 Tax=Piloderma croceum (strain F 1598) TaxID=765440 RepID=A0A0C3FWN6_PILCF|nr:hypothetical protein PILCRDRAFT_459797 [Piloderma croceum F 1598]